MANGQKGSLIGSGVGAAIGGIFGGGVGAVPGAALGGGVGGALSGLFGKKAKPAPPLPWYKRYEGLLLLGGAVFVGGVLYYAVKAKS